MEAFNWSRLYGGGGIIINTEQKPDTPLDMKKITQDSKLEFLAADVWELYTDIPMWNPWENMSQAKVYNYYGMRLDRSRVIPIMGKKAPSFIRNRLRGWGMSELERVVRSINSYLKNQDLIFELLDEAKIDVIKILNLADTLMSPDGERLIRKRLQLVTSNKNYKASIAMDANDDYDQKQIHFSGLPEMIVQIQYLVCAALKRPYSKIFGKGSSGFSSGEDDLENYNTIVDSEIRTPATQLIKWVVNLRAQQLFGRELPDFRPRWKPLRTMTEKDEADINSKKTADYLQLCDRQIMTKQQVARKLTEDGYILFSDEEIEAIDDDFNPDETTSIEDLI
jgi:phage-related protein (TIGR01555 family)